MINGLSTKEALIVNLFFWRRFRNRLIHVIQPLVTASQLYYFRTVYYIPAERFITFKGKLFEFVDENVLRSSFLLSTWRQQANSVNTCRLLGGRLGGGSLLEERKFGFLWPYKILKRLGRGIGWGFLLRIFGVWMPLGFITLFQSKKKPSFRAGPCEFFWNFNLT